MSRLASLLVMFLFVGCVPKSQYLEMEQKYEASAAQVSEEQAKSARLEGKLDRMRERTKARVQAYVELLQEFKPLIDRGALELKVEKGSITIGMAADVLFPSGSADLSEEGQANIAEIARLLSRRSDR